jgi:hypothetical protein
MRVKAYIASVADAEGVTSTYLFEARTRMRVKRDVREWVKRTDWAATIVGIERAVDHRHRTSARRMLRVAGITFAVAGSTIMTIMIIGLSLEGAL